MRYMNFESNGTLHSTNGDFNKNTYSNIYNTHFVSIQQAKNHLGI